MRHLFLKTATFFALIGLLGSPLAHAQSEATKAARETVIENLAEIKDVQSGTLSPEEKAEKERELTRTTLSNLLVLSELETEDILLKLETLVLEEDNRVFVQLSEELEAKLKDHKKYFAALQEVLGATESIEGIRELAGQFEEKRESSYNGDIKKAIELLLTFHVEEILTKANDRFEKLNTAVKRAPGTESEIAVRVDLLRVAALNLSHAREAALSAREKLSAYLLPLVAEDVPAVVDPKIELDPEVEPIEAVREPTIQESLEQALLATREGYRNFIELSELLEKQGMR